MKLGTLQRLLESNVIWRLCDEHRHLRVVRFTVGDEVAKCTNCQTEAVARPNDTVLSVGVTRCGHTVYAIGDLSSTTNPYVVPLAVCDSCSDVLSQYLEDQDDCFLAVRNCEKLPEPLMCIIVDYVFKAIVKCPFHP